MYRRFFKQTVMVLVRMRDQDRRRFGEVERRRDQARSISRRIERTPDIQDQPFITASKLDAVAADRGGGAVDGEGQIRQVVPFPG